MGGQFQSHALIAIRKAIELEPDKLQIPKYLELQGHIESSIGKIALALDSFQRAKQIIRDNPKLFTSAEASELEKGIISAIKQLNSKTET